MASWEELERKYGGESAAETGAGGDQWSALEQKYGAPVVTRAADGPVPKGSTEPKEVTLSDRVRAAATGVNRGFFADLLGMPVDAAANVLDLGKAAVGLGYNEVKKAVTGKPSAPPEWTAPFDRRGVPGSSEWIGRQINAGADRLGLASPIENPNAQDLISRVVHMGGRVAGGSVVPDPRAKIGAVQQATNMGMGAAGGLLAGATGEVAPEWAGLFGMTPQLLNAVIAGSTKLSIRGGENGRKDMEQRIQDLKNGGIEAPSVGLASGNNLIMGIENLLSQTPGSVSLYAAAREKNLAGMRDKTNQVRDDISPTFGRVEAGSAVQSDLKGSFKDRVNATTKALNDRVQQVVGPDRVVSVPETLLRAEQLSTPIRGAEATSGQLINQRIAQIAQNLNADVFGSAPVVRGGNRNQNPTLNTALEPVINAPIANSSLWNALPPAPPQTVTNPSLWNAPAAPTVPMQRRDIAVIQPGNGPANASMWNARKEEGIPFSALKGLRTSIGEEASSNAIIGTPEQAQFKRLYGAMSEDMKRAVNAVDRQNAGVPVGPLDLSQQPGSVAFKRANGYYSNAATRSEDLNNLANRTTPESAYKSISESLNAGDTLYKKLRGAMSTETRQKVVSTVVDELGNARPGQQNADGDAWSPATFLSNYSKLHQNGGGAELFKRLPGGMRHADQLADIAKTAEMLGESSKVWSNPSGTAPAITARGAMYALTVGAFVQPLYAAGTAVGLVGMNQASKRLLLNPMFVNWLSSSKTVPPAKAQAYAQRLLMNAKMTNDKQFQGDVQAYLESVQDALKEVE